MRPTTSPVPMAAPPRRRAGHPRPSVERAHPVAAARVRLEVLLLSGALSEADYRRRLDATDWIDAVNTLADMGAA